MPHAGVELARELSTCASDLSTCLSSFPATASEIHASLGARVAELRDQANTLAASAEVASPPGRAVSESCASYSPSFSSLLSSPLSNGSPLSGPLSPPNASEDPVAYGEWKARMLLRLRRYLSSRLREARARLTHASSRATAADWSTRMLEGDLLKVDDALRNLQSDCGLSEAPSPASSDTWASSAAVAIPEVASGRPGVESRTHKEATLQPGLSQGGAVPARAARKAPASGGHTSPMNRVAERLAALRRDQSALPTPRILQLGADGEAPSKELRAAEPHSCALSASSASDTDATAPAHQLSTPGEEPVVEAEAEAVVEGLRAAGAATAAGGAAATRVARAVGAAKVGARWVETAEGG